MKLTGNNKIPTTILIALFLIPFASAITNYNNGNVMLFLDGNNINYTFTGYEDNGSYFGTLNYYRPEQAGELFSLPESNITMNVNYTNNLLTIFNATEIQNSSNWNETKTIVHLAENEYISISLNADSSGIDWNLNSVYIIINSADANITTNAWVKVNETECQPDNTKVVNYHHNIFGDNQTIESCTYVAPAQLSQPSSSPGGGPTSHNHPALITPTPILQETRTLEQPTVQEQTQPTQETTGPTGAAVTGNTNITNYALGGIVGLAIIGMAGFFLWKKYNK